MAKGSARAGRQPVARQVNQQYPILVLESFELSEKRPVVLAHAVHHDQPGLAVAGVLNNDF